MSILNVVGSLIWIDCWLSIVYINSGKRFCNANWLKRLKDDDDGDWKVVS